jgi:hypothetical protein
MLLVQINYCYSYVITRSYPMVIKQRLKMLIFLVSCSIRADECVTVIIMLVLWLLNGPSIRNTRLLIPLVLNADILSGNRLPSLFCVFGHVLGRCEMYIRWVLVRGIIRSDFGMIRTRRKRAWTFRRLFHAADVVLKTQLSPFKGVCAYPVIKFPLIMIFTATMPCL